MKKFMHVIKNNARMLAYYLKFAPVGFISHTLFCVWVAIVDTLSGPVALKYIFNGIMGEKSFKEIVIFLLIVGGAMLIRHIWGAWCEYINAVSPIRVESGMRRVIFEHARKMDLEYYETPKFYNDFVWASSMSDSKIFDVFYSFQVFIARLSETIMFGSFIVTTDAALLIIVALSLAVRAVFERKIVKKRYEMDVEAKPLERRRDYITRVFYLADYAKELRLSDMHKTLFERLKETMSSLKAVYAEGGKKLAAYRMISSAAAYGVLDFMMYLYLSYQTMVTKALQFGDLAGLISAVGEMSWRTRDFINVLTEFGKHSLYIDSFYEFLKYKPKIEERTGAGMPGEVQEISIENLSFKYTGEEKYSLKNINLKIKPYEKLAIVGYNGAGKSTLAKLLLRFYDSAEGSIKIGGRDIKDFDTRKYRESFGAVFQDYKIFAGSIAENVAMGFTEDCDRERITDSLEKSGFGEKLASLPDAELTSVTREFDENGVNFSGGEEQKIAIARIFCKGCGYVILDEPSSALDPVSEYKLNKTMMTLSENKTVIFISHRLSTTCMADRIIMMENGRIIEEGSHDELMAAGGKYAEMFNMQAEKYR